jgi:hypothetical protein
VLPEGWTEHYDEDNDNEVYRHTDGRVEQKSKPGKPEGIITIANAIPDTKALSSLHVGRNGIPEKEMREIMLLLPVRRA